jgi:hypothetical protein
MKSADLPCMRADRRRVWDWSAACRRRGRNWFACGAEADPYFRPEHTRIAGRDHCLGLPVDEWRRADFGFVVRTKGVRIVYVFGSLCDGIVYVFLSPGR